MPEAVVDRKRSKGRQRRGLEAAYEPTIRPPAICGIVTVTASPGRGPSGMAQSSASGVPMRGGFSGKYSVRPSGRRKHRRPPSRSASPVMYAYSGCCWSGPPGLSLRRAIWSESGIVTSVAGGRVSVFVLVPLTGVWELCLSVSHSLDRVNTVVPGEEA